MTKALVTGGAGFLGSHLCDYLIDEMGFDVVVLDDLSGGFEDNVPAGATLVRGSVVDHGLIDGLFDEHGFDYVYHLAAYAAEGLSHFIKRFNYQNNLIGSVNLINASVNHDVKRFVFTSSIAVYGTNQVPMTEALTPQPEDSYGIAKYAVEQELAVSHEMFGLDATVFRPHNVYGERQNLGDRYRNVIGIFMNNLMKGLDLPVFGDGEQQRAFTYVKDIIPGMARCVNVEGARNQVFNIGCDTTHTVNELARMVMDAMGTEATVRHVQARNEVKVAYSDHSKFYEVFELPSDRQTPLAEGLGFMAAWAKEAGARQSAAFGSIEVEKNLPPSWRAVVAGAVDEAEEGKR